MAASPSERGPCSISRASECPQAETKYGERAQNFERPSNLVPQAFGSHEQRHEASSRQRGQSRAMPPMAAIIPIVMAAVTKSPAAKTPRANA